MLLMKSLLQSLHVAELRQRKAGQLLPGKQRDTQHEPPSTDGVVGIELEARSCSPRRVLKWWAAEEWEKKQTSEALAWKPAPRHVQHLGQFSKSGSLLGSFF